MSKSQMDHDLDELQQIAKRLNGLLSDRQSGNYGWLMLLTDDMKQLKAWTDRVVK